MRQAHYCTHFTDEAAQTQKRLNTFPKAMQPVSERKSVFHPGLSDSKAHALCASKLLALRWDKGKVLAE